MRDIFTNVECSEWRTLYEKYDEVLKAKAEKMKPDKKKEILTLDKWYQSELPKIICKRNKKYITHDEICRLMTWKLTRGKFRPRLQQMVASNTEDDVKNASLKSFSLLPDLSAAIQALTVLKAIGPATASAILAAGCPDLPFMADESMLALPEISSLEYNLKTYLFYAEKIKNITKKLQKEDKEFNWNCHKVEITLWTYYLGNKLIDNFMENLEDRSEKTSDNDDEPASKKKKILKKDFNIC